MSTMPRFAHLPLCNSDKCVAINISDISSFEEDRLGNVLVSLKTGKEYTLSAKRLKEYFKDHFQYNPDYQKSSYEDDKILEDFNNLLEYFWVNGGFDLAAYRNEVVLLPGQNEVFDVHVQNLPEEEE